MNQTALQPFPKILKRIQVIPNFIDLSRFSLKPREHFKKAIAPGDERVITHTSNFRKVKRTMDVIQIFKKIKEKIPSKLLMVGDGPERANNEKLCRELGIVDDVRFLGKQDAVEEILSVTDLFLMPSESESFGLAALEAMACKVPVIATNVGGIPELIVNGVTGFMSNVGDIDDMAKNALHILEDCERLNIFKKAALNRAKKFELSLILPHYEAYYQKIVDASKANL
jgi:N-acetyl-alpha-D-glucosaminyl L-malate synthase BshA